MDDSQRRQCRRRFAGWCSALAVLALAGCSKPGSYVPLEPQLAWEYAITAQKREGESAAGKPQRGQSSMRNLARRELGSRQVTPQSIELGGQFATVFRAEDTDGVHVVATQGPGETEPEIKSGSYDLRFPLVVGRTWDDTSESMFLKTSVEVEGESRIEALDDVVTVPSGTYKDCVRVSFSGEGRDGSSALAIQTVRWFAPGVGMVKYVHDDRSGAGSGTFTAELTTFKQL